MSNRRQFIRQTAAFGLTAGLLPGIASTTEVNAASVPNAAEPEITREVDVLVVGGGTAGTIAAIQAGRAGASVLLVERNSQLGGTMTTGGVAFPGLFDAWGKQVIAGIGWELVKESVELDEGKLPDFAKVPQRHWHNQVYINQFLYAILAEEKCAQAGVEIAYYEFPQAATDTKAADATGKERLAISFWIWALWDTGPNRIVDDFEMRVAEAVERGFNCFRIEGGAGITHDAEGRPRGELEFYPVLPGHDLLTRGQQHMTGGRVDLLKGLIELCTVAKRYKFKLILSSWHYLHTFWFTDKHVTAELLGLPLEKRFMVFARGLDRILDELKQRGLADTIATAEIFNEVSPRYHGNTVDHEESRWIS